MPVANTEQTPHLRLVPSNSSPEPIITDRRARDLTQLPPQVRQLRRAVLAAGLQAGVSINPDAVSVILAAKMANQSPLLYFTEDMVWDLLWFDICNWCGQRRIDVPVGVPQAMWLLLKYLDNEGLLDPDSDHLDDLFEPLQTSSGLDPAGHPRFPA